MGAKTSTDIRNIVLTGHAGAGKTTLIEKLLHKSGALHTPGSVEKGTTVCDFDPQEKELKHSIDTAICHLETDGKFINLIDTPGYPDFIGRSISVLPAAETVAVVVNAQSGIEQVTQRMMEIAGERKLCRMVIINKMDIAGDKLHALLREIRERFGNECLPMNLPAKNGTEVLDCYWTSSGEETDFASVKAAHTEIIDQVVEVDEKLMELYLEQGEELAPEQLHDAFEQAMREGHLVPVCFTSAETGVGLDELMHVFSELMPNPLEGNPPPFIKGEGDNEKPVDVKPVPDDHVIGHVFKVTVDPYVGRLGVFRVHQGTVKPSSQLFVGDGRKAFKVSHLYQLQGKEHVEMTEAVPGDICAVAKVDDIHFDAVLHDSHDEDQYHLKSIDLSPPMYGLAISAKKRGTEQKLSDALHKITAEDPSLRVEFNASANETVLRGMGEMHLRLLFEKIKENYNVELETHTPSVEYRETITRAAEGHHRHKKQTGGAGQFGEVYLRIEPLPRNQGFEFVSKVVGGSIPSQLIPAVEKGVREVLQHGAISGHPLQDLRVTVYDGKHHAVDSKEVAFVAAGRKAFLEAIKKAAPIILEPIVNINIAAPSESMGDLAGDLSSMRGRIKGNQTLGGNRVSISGQVPLSELGNYHSRLNSLTGGEGSYRLAKSHYDPVPPQTQKEMISDYRPGGDDD